MGTGFQLLAIITLFIFSFSFGQTIIINEVSQGESGSKEYVEFVVIDSNPTIDCSTLEPACVNIQGWIFDDNSGYHGTTGIAGGAVRFSYDPLWECIPLGTIILIYNDADANPEIPSDDLTMSDGNCRIIAPISNTSLFQSNSTTPASSGCSYPSSGWTNGGVWTNVSMVNGSGDCARIVDLLGCEVFTVCWTDSDANNLIYFDEGVNGSSSASQTVFYFNGTDPYAQVNWSIGCANLSGCGAQNQTPGAPNNTLNADYIAQFNNNCIPISPLTSAVQVINEDDGSCNGEASATGAGSIGGYAYEWFDENFNPIGQTGSSATNLCGGTYYVFTTSSVGCIDTVLVVIQSSITQPGIAELPYVKVPNVFSPNGDGVNEFFVINSQNIEQLEVSILNRWGEVVFESDIVNFKWDGQVNSSPANEGVYFIIYKATAVNAEVFEGHSFLQLIR